MQAAGEPRDAKFRGAGAMFSANGRGLKGSESRDMGFGASDFGTWIPEILYARRSKASPQDVRSKVAAGLIRVSLWHLQTTTHVQDSSLQPLPARERVAGSRAWRSVPTVWGVY